MVKCSKSKVRRLKTALLRWKKVPEKQRERMKMVLLREYGLTQPAIAEAMGSSLSTVNRAHMAYDEGGIKALKPKPNPGRKHQNMTLAEEKIFFRHNSNSTIYALLDRHGWRKLMPRPYHPKRDIAAQNAFKKKGFPMLSGKPGWLPPGVVAACASCSPTKRASAE